METLKIAISSAPGVGKTSIGLEIKRMLKQRFNIEASINDTDDDCFGIEDGRHELRISSIKDRANNLEVIIECKTGGN